MRDDEFEWDDRKAARNLREMKMTQTPMRSASVASAGSDRKCLW
jgi:hypothetical protein